jgi:hypothetical protein
MEYQTITPPYWKGYILIECNDGKIYKYVRNLTKRALKGYAIPWFGDSVDTSYFWGDSIGDTIGQTADTAGRIMFDFNRLATIYVGQASVTGGFMKWPETGGDTAVLRRINKEQPQPFSASSPNNSSIYMIPGGVATTAGPSTGDTNSYRAYNIQAFTYLRLVNSAIQSMAIIQERIPDWYKAQQLAFPSNYPYWPGMKV